MAQGSCLSGVVNTNKLEARSFNAASKIVIPEDRTSIDK
jgi:hypothetical protein